MSDNSSGNLPTQRPPQEESFEDVPFDRPTSSSAALASRTTTAHQPTTDGTSSSRSSNPLVDPLSATSGSAIDDREEVGTYKGSSFSHRIGGSNDQLRSPTASQQQHRNLRLPQRISTSPRFANLSPTSPTATHRPEAYTKTYPHSNRSTPTGETSSSNGGGDGRGGGSQSSLSPGQNSEFESKMLLPAVPREAYAHHTAQIPGANSSSTVHTGPYSPSDHRADGSDRSGGAAKDFSRRSSAATITSSTGGRRDSTSAIKGSGYVGREAVGQRSPQRSGQGRVVEQITGDGSTMRIDDSTRSYRPQPGCSLCGIVSEAATAASSTPSSSFPSTGQSALHNAYPTNVPPSASSIDTASRTETHTDSYVDPYEGGKGPSSEPISRPGSANPLIQSFTDHVHSIPPSIEPSASTSSTYDPRRISLGGTTDRWFTIQGKKIILQTPEITIWESPHVVPSSSHRLGFPSFLGGGGKNSDKGKGKENVRPDAQVEAVASEGRHLVVALNRHVESVYELGPSDIPLLHGTLQTVHSLLDRIQDRIDLADASGGKGKGKALDRRVGFISGNLTDAAHPYAHIHIHAILGAFDLATWYRKNAVYGWLNWYELEDLIAEIRETTSNNRVKSGYGPARRNAPINNVIEAGSEYGPSNALDDLQTETQPRHSGMRLITRDSDKPSAPDHGQYASATSVESEIDIEALKRQKLAEIDNIMRYIALDKRETDRAVDGEQSSAAGMV